MYDSNSYHVRSLFSLQVGEGREFKTPIHVKSSETAQNITMIDEVGFEVDLARGGVGSGLNADLSKLKFVPTGTSLKIRHLHPSNEVSTRLCIKDFCIGYNSKKVRLHCPVIRATRSSPLLTCNTRQDAEVLFTKKMKVGKLQIRQRVPQGRWELVPSPELKLSLPALSRGKFSEESDLSYDLLTSRGSLDQRITYDGFLKLGLRVSSLSNSHGMPFLIPLTRLASYPCLLSAAMNKDTKVALEISLSAALKKPWMRSIGVDHSDAFGTVLSYEADLASRVKLESAISLRRKELWTAIEISPTSESMVKLTAEATCTSFRRKPMLLMGLRFEP